MQVCTHTHKHTHRHTNAHTHTNMHAIAIVNETLKKSGEGYVIGYMVEGKGREKLFVLHL